MRDDGINAMKLSTNGKGRRRQKVKRGKSFKSLTKKSSTEKSMHSLPMPLPKEIGKRTIPYRPKQSEK